MPALRRIGSAAALAALTVVCLPVDAGAASTFTVVAGGDLVRFSISPDPPIFVEYPVDLGGVVAGARLDSLGTSMAYASTPFPGDATVQMPGLMAGVSGGAINLPEYPLYANSDYPSAPERDAQAGSLILQAASGPLSSRSLVQDGANRSVVEVGADPGSDAVTGAAEVNLGYVDLGGFLSIDGLRSRAMASQRPDGELVRTSDLHVGDLTVLGRPLAIPADQLPAIEADPLIGELAKQGVQVSYLAPLDTEHGVISAALIISWLAPVPNYGQARITAQLGRTFASVTNQPVTGNLLPAPSGTFAPAPSPAAEAPERDAAAPGGDAAAVFAPSPAPRAASPVVPAFRAGPVVPFPVEASVTPAPSVPAPSEPVAPARGRQQALDTALAAVDRTPISRLGGLLALAGLAVVLTGALFRRYGLRAS